MPQALLAAALSGADRWLGSDTPAPGARLEAREPARRRSHPERELAMPRLYMITVPGLEVKSDWRIVHDRLLDDFEKVDDVLPTTTPETLLIVYRGSAHVDEWLDALSEAVLLRGMRTSGARRRSGRPTDSSVHSAHPNQEGIPA
jgi:hypothetical protein